MVKEISLSDSAQIFDKEFLSPPASVPLGTTGPSSRTHFRGPLKKIPKVVFSEQQ